MLRLWQAEVVFDENIQNKVAQQNPGTVLAESDNDTGKGIYVATGDGVLCITELQAEGKRRMPTADFLNANSLLGQVLK